MNGKKIVKEISEKILKCKKILISSHLRPDGDSIGTGLALLHLFRKMGKSADFINIDKTPFPYTRLPGADLIVIGEIKDQDYDLALLLECSEEKRSGHKNIKRFFTINIDHHNTTDFYANINWIDPSASAVGEMVFELILALKGEFDFNISTNLYTAIASDTGAFRFSNTTPRALEVCAFLAKNGATPYEVSKLIFDTYSYQKVKLLGEVLSTLNVDMESGIAYISMRKKLLEELGLSEVDTEDIISMVRSIEGVNIVVFVKETGERKFRISLRSKGGIDSGKIAEKYGGGGHFHAAGFSLEGDFKTVLKNAIKIVKSNLKN
ncbi:MAG: DHH family phosphoesterase [Candidatus Aminicenantia bacterium]